MPTKQECDPQLAAKFFAFWFTAVALLWLAFSLADSGAFSRRSRGRIADKVDRRTSEEWYQNPMNPLSPFSPLNPAFHP
jgi:hypothetical protein